MGVGRLAKTMKVQSVLDLLRSAFAAHQGSTLIIVCRLQLTHSEAPFCTLERHGSVSSQFPE
jgi:hypothetical protein